MKANNFWDGLTRTGIVHPNSTEVLENSLVLFYKNDTDISHSWLFLKTYIFSIDWLVRVESSQILFLPYMACLFKLAV